jgi:hypothetical protein
MLSGHAAGRILIPGVEVPEPQAYRFHDPFLAELARIATEQGSRMALTYLASTYAANMLGQITTTGLFMSIHTASPSNTGANEIVAGTGYTAVSGGRPPMTWGSVSSGVVTTNDTQTFAMLVTEGGGIPYFGIWTANTAGTYIFGGPTSGLSGSIPSGANVTFTSSVTLTQAG